MDPTWHDSVRELHVALARIHAKVVLACSVGGPLHAFNLIKGWITKHHST